MSLKEGVLVLMGRQARISRHLPEGGVDVFRNVLRQRVPPNTDPATFQVALERAIALYAIQEYGTHCMGIAFVPGNGVHISWITRECHALVDQYARTVIVDDAEFERLASRRSVKKVHHLLVHGLVVPVTMAVTGSRFNLKGDPVIWEYGNE